MRAAIWTGMALGALMGAAVVAPAAADDPSGTVSITFDQRAWSTITSEVVVTATGKAEPIGRCCPCGPPPGETAVAACCACPDEREATDSTCQTTGAAARSFTMPALTRGKNTVAARGGLTLSRAEASLRIENLVVDWAHRTGSANVVGLRRHKVLTLSNVKRGAWVRAQMHLAKGQAAVLNRALETDVFTPRMKLGELVYSSD